MSDITSFLGGISERGNMSNDLAVIIPIFISPAIHRNFTFIVLLLPLVVVADLLQNGLTPTKYVYNMADLCLCLVLVCVHEQSERNTDETVINAL